MPLASISSDGPQRWRWNDRFLLASLRRGYFQEAKGENVPVAQTALRRIVKFYEFEGRIRGPSTENFRAYSLNRICVSRLARQSKVGEQQL